MRQVHHWTALVFLGAIVVHLARIFFTGAFRRPREINWLIGLGLLLLALGEGITGYSLPGRPAVRDGPADHRLGRPVDPVRRPLGRVAVLRRRVPDARHPQPPVRVPRHAAAGPADRGRSPPTSASLWLQKHTQYRAASAREDNVVGLPFWPGQVFRSLGLFFMTAAVVTLVAGLIQINPVWLYGPYVPSCRGRAGAARLVRRLARGRPAPGPADRADHPGRHDPVAVRARASLIPGLLVGDAGRLAVRRGAR